MTIISPTFSSLHLVGRHGWATPATHIVSKGSLEKEIAENNGQGQDPTSGEWFQGVTLRQRYYNGLRDAFILSRADLRLLNRALETTPASSHAKEIYWKDERAVFGSVARDNPRERRYLEGEYKKRQAFFADCLRDLELAQSIGTAVKPYRDSLDVSATQRIQNSDRLGVVTAGEAAVFNAHNRERNRIELHFREECTKATVSLRACADERGVVQPFLRAELPLRRIPGWLDGALRESCRIPQNIVVQWVPLPR